MGAVAVAKAAQESAILTAVRRLLEALEEKLSGQITRVQQQGDRLRDAAFSRVDAKMGNMEGLQSKFDRKLAELSGNYKGLSDEMQAQIRRIDQMDTRLWEWRHQVEDEVRTKFAEVEQSHQQINSVFRLASATNDDSLKRITSRVRRIEGLVEERLSYSDETNQNLVALDTRLQEIEVARIHQLTLGTADQMNQALLLQSQANAAETGTGNNPGLASMESRLLEACKKIDLSSRESQDMQTRVEAQEERLRTLRTLLDTKEEHFRHNKFDRQDWETRSKELQSVVSELDKQRVAHSEKLEVFTRKFDNQEKSHDEVCDQVRKLQERGYYNVSESAAPAAETSEVGREIVAAGGATNSGLVPTAADAAAAATAAAAAKLSVDDCAARIKVAEERMDVVDAELQGVVRSEAELGPRVARIVDTLPKVVDQEKCIRELHEKVGDLEARANVMVDRGMAHDQLTSRISRVEVDVNRLKLEIEGVEAPHMGR